MAEEANDKHLTAWAELCRKYALEHTPLEPSAGADTLLNRQLCLDGGRLRAIMAIDVKRPTLENLLEVSYTCWCRQTRWSDSRGLTLRNVHFIVS